MADVPGIQPRVEWLFVRVQARGYRFSVLLLMILGSLVFQLAAPEEDWAPVVAIVIQG